MLDFRKKKEVDSGNDSNKENKADDIVKSGPLKGFQISIPGDDDLVDEMLSPTGSTGSQVGNESD